MAYDEFSYFEENAAEVGLALLRPPLVRREFVEVDATGRRLSALVWGAAPPEIVLLHGGGQNAHTWDTMLLALDRPAVAIDLPGHGHSDGPAPSGATATGYARDVAVVVQALCPGPPGTDLVVGMSLGGLTAIELSALAPGLMRGLMLIDILPDPDPEAAGQISAFLNGPETFDSFDEILARTVRFNPGRSESSLRRGILHNAIELPDGRWQWRHRRHTPRLRPTTATEAADISSRLWGFVADLAVPLELVHGLADGSVVTAEHVATLRHRQPSARVEAVPNAGHSVQGDQPVRLAALVEQFLAELANGTEPPAG
jgi:pimeloyl-ACP methyl ester carboxylesterase